MSSHFMTNTWILTNKIYDNKKVKDEKKEDVTINGLK